MQEPCVQSLGWEDPPEKERQPTPVFLPGRILMDRRAWGATVCATRKVLASQRGRERIHNYKFSKVNAFLRGGFSSSLLPHTFFFFLHLKKLSAFFFLLDPVLSLKHPQILQPRMMMGTGEVHAQDWEEAPGALCI